MTSRRLPQRLFEALADPVQRAAAAQELAAALDVQAVLLFVKDTELAVMLPAPGMPKTVTGGPGWRAFLRRCLHEPAPRGPVDLVAGDEAEAQALVHQGAALVLVGGAPDLERLQHLREQFPLLAAVLVAQQALRIESAEAAEARAAAARAHDLAKALDAARASAAQLNLELRREHERKDEFLAMLSHELRNPLSPLVHSIEILRRARDPGDRATGGQLEVMARQLQQLTRLVDDLLDVSRVSRGSIELRRERVPLEEILDDSIEAARPLLEDRRHTLQRQSAGAVVVHGDRVRLTQVFVNLLANACRYTDPGGRISLSVVSDEHRVSVVVQDSGIGIPQDMLSRVFDMFAQVPTAQVRLRGGLGIGLTLVRRLVELHGGRVSAYSRGEGQGSTFTVSLPQGLGAAPPAPAARAPMAPAAPAGAGRPRVLVVDDNADGAETIAALIDCLGGDARVAREGREALRVAPDFEPHLILLDIGLPGMDGYETARRLRELPGVHARVVALTGYGAPQDRERSRAAGFDEHLVKPVSAATVEGLLRQLPAMQDAS